MEIFESALLAEFIGYIKSNWSAHSRVDQRRRRLRQLVSKVRAVVDAAESGAGAAAVRDDSFSRWLRVLRSEAVRGQEVLDDAAARAAAVATSARRFVAGFKALFVCSAEVDRLTDAVEQLERLAGPGGDLDMFVRVLNLDAARAVVAATEEDMDVDGRPARGSAPRHWQEGSGCSCGCADTVVALLTSPGAKRKRVYGGVDPGSTSRGEVDAVQPQKRRLVAWMRSHQGLSSGFGRVSSAPRELPPPPAFPRSRRARSVALALSRIRRRIGKPATTRHRLQPSLGQHFSRISS